MSLKMHSSLLRTIILKSFHFQPWYSDRKKILPSHLKQPQHGQNVWNNCLWGIGYHKKRTAIPWTQKTNEVSGITAPAMREFLGHGTGRRNPGKAHKAPWVEEMSANSWGKPRQLEFTRQHAQKRESNTRTELWDLLRILSDIQLSTYQHIYVENYSKPGKEPPKRISGNSAQHLHRAWNTACAHKPEWNTS